MVVRVEVSPVLLSEVSDGRLLPTCQESSVHHVHCGMRHRGRSRRLLATVDVDLRPLHRELPLHRQQQ